MIDRAITSFVNRSWREVESLKADYWVAAKARLGPGGALWVSEGLRQQALASHPDWPSSREREDDLSHHARVARNLALARPRTGR